MSDVSITATARSFPQLPYTKIKNDILGTSHEVSLVFVGATRAQKLNQTYRNKSYVPNVLSFPLDKKVSEIFITPTVAARQAKKLGVATPDYIGFLFIHALLHLKGLDHSDTMERTERRYAQKFGFVI